MAAIGMNKGLLLTLSKGGGKGALRGACPFMINKLMYRPEVEKHFQEALRRGWKIPSIVWRRRINILVQNLIDIGFYNEADLIYLMGGHDGDLNYRALDLVRLVRGTVNNPASRLKGNIYGLRSEGANENNYIDTTFSTVKYAATNMGICAYIRNQGLGNTNSIHGSAVTNAGDYFQNLSSAGSTIKMNTVNTHDATIDLTGSGLLMGTRESTTAIKAYKNDLVLQSANQTSSGTALTTKRFTQFRTITSGGSPQGGGGGNGVGFYACGSATMGSIRASLKQVLDYHFNPL